MNPEFEPVTILPPGVYEDIEMVAFGGTGRVYRARRTDSGKLVALKVIAVLNDQMLQRVQREIRLIASIPQSENLVNLIDSHSSTKPPVSILVMEWVDGTNLQNFVKSQKGRIPYEIIAAVSRRLCLGIALLHQHGLIHRDIKPSNVLLAVNGEVKVSDYGLIISAENDEKEPITKELSIPGTLQYLAPEVLLGAIPDQKSDIYSLGLTFLFMVLGDLPMFGKSFSATVQMIVRGGIADQIPKTLPASWQDLIRSMIALDPAKRLSSVQLAFDALVKISVPANGSDQKGLELFLDEQGSIPSLPDVEPPRALLSADRIETDSSVPALVQSLAGQVAKFESSLQAITTMVSRRDVERSLEFRSEEGADLLAEKRVQDTFEAIRKRVNWMYKISLTMMVSLFTVLIGTVLASVVLGLLFHQPVLSIIFGSGGVLSLVGVVLWKPMDKILLATIVMQQLELVQLNFARALTGTRQERREAFRDVSLQLEMLLTKTALSVKAK